MEIGLIDVDGHNFPNLALMKIAAFEKQCGNNVSFVVPMFKYDRVYMSKIFDFTPDFETVVNTGELVKGGRAYDKAVKLPQDIEYIYPDYSLYKIKDTAYGYLTRGCPVGCEFCDVQNLEGNISYKVADLESFWKGQKQIKLLDPNLLACKDKYELLQQLVDSKAYIDFNQGLDIRRMTDKAIELIMQMKIKMIHFAWDTDKESEKILQGLKHFKLCTKIDYRKTKVYVLVNYNTDFEFDLYRIYKLKEIGYDPYVMIYDKASATMRYKHLARWVNNRFIFRSCETFADYKR